MKFQSLEESSGVSIFQEYIIGLNSLVEKSFIKLEYHYEYSLAFLLVCIYRPSNLFKIGVIIYSSIIILKLKYCSSDFFLPLVPHLMTFDEFFFSVVVICQEETVRDGWGDSLFPGSPEEDMTRGSHCNPSSACYCGSHSASKLLGGQKRNEV